MFPYTLGQDERYTLLAVQTKEPFKVQRSTMVRMKTIYNFIFDYTKEHNYAPNYREIMQASNLSSTSVVRYYIDIMIKAGLVTMTENTARSIQLVGVRWTPPPNVMGENDDKPTYEELLQAIEDTNLVLSKAIPVGSTYRVPATLSGRNPGDLPRMATLTIRALRTAHRIPKPV